MKLKRIISALICLTMLSSYNFQIFADTKNAAEVDPIAAQQATLASFGLFFDLRCENYVQRNGENSYPMPKLSLLSEDTKLSLTLEDMAIILDAVNEIDPLVYEVDLRIWDGLFSKGVTMGEYNDVMRSSVERVLQKKAASGDTSERHSTYNALLDRTLEKNNISAPTLMLKQIIYMWRLQAEQLAM